MRKTVVVAAAAIAATLGWVAARAQDPQGQAKAKQGPRPMGTEDGFALFQTRCMGCHGNPAMADRAPSPSAIRQLPPERIYSALTDGVMKVQAASLSDEEKRRIAEFMSGSTPLGEANAGDAKNMPNHCSGNPAVQDPASAASWNGWGVDISNTRFQTAKAAGLSAADVPRLKLKWAFGYPKGVSAHGQPTVIGNRVFVGTDIGYVYALDAKTGKELWKANLGGSIVNAPITYQIDGKQYVSVISGHTLVTFALRN